MPKMYEDEEYISSIDEVPEKYREIVKKALEENKAEKNDITEITSGELGEEITSEEDISKYFCGKDEYILGHGTNGGEEVVNAIISSGLKVQNSQEASFYMNTLRGLDSTSVILGNGSENFFEQNQKILDNWEHKDAKDIIIISLPTKYISHAFSIGVDNYEPFYVNDNDKGGLLLRPEFIKGRYNAKNKTFTPNKNYYKNLDISKKEELLKEVKSKFTKLFAQNWLESPEEAKEFFSLDDKEFDELVVNWYIEKLKKEINDKELEEDKTIDINSNNEIDDSDWNDNWGDEIDDITEKLENETKEEQMDIISIDEIESVEKREMEKQREELTNEKDID